MKCNDAPTMGGILDERFILVPGSGKAYGRADLLDSAKSGKITYEQQDEEPGAQAVRVFGDTAVVTALPSLKGVNDGKVFERRPWFSDSNVRTKDGWKYAFGRASLPLPASQQASCFLQLRRFPPRISPVDSECRNPSGTSIASR